MHYYETFIGNRSLILTVSHTHKSWTKSGKVFVSGCVSFQYLHDWEEKTVTVWLCSVTSHLSQACRRAALWPGWRDSTPGSDSGTTVDPKKEKKKAKYSHIFACWAHVTQLLRLSHFYLHWDQQHHFRGSSCCSFSGFVQILILCPIIIIIMWHRDTQHSNVINWAEVTVRSKKDEGKKQQQLPAWTWESCTSVNMAVNQNKLRAPVWDALCVCTSVSMTIKQSDERSLMQIMMRHLRKKPNITYKRTHIISDLIM